MKPPTPGKSNRPCTHTNKSLPSVGVRAFTAVSQSGACRATRSISSLLLSSAAVVTSHHSGSLSLLSRNPPSRISYWVFSSVEIISCLIFPLAFCLPLSQLHARRSKPRNPFHDPCVPRHPLLALPVYLHSTVPIPNVSRLPYATAFFKF